MRKILHNGRHSMVCVPCRVVTRAAPWGGNGSIVCPHCGKDMARMGSKWRAPRRNADAAWRRIESGEWLWDRKAKAHAPNLYWWRDRPVRRDSRGKVARHVANTTMIEG